MKDVWLFEFTSKPFIGQKWRHGRHPRKLQNLTRKVPQNSHQRG